MRDDFGAHDFLCTPCSQAMFERQYGVTVTVLFNVFVRDVLVAVFACSAAGANGSGARPSA